jgi:glucosylceramidase
VVTSGTATLTVDDSTTYQTFNGFGGTFNELGWSYLSLLSPSDQTQAMTLLFDATNGAGFVYGRIPIGSNDFATSFYTDDDSATNDYSMANFSIARDKQYVIPYVQAALKINPNIHLWASPWSPPGWMKVNGQPLMGWEPPGSVAGTVGGEMIDDPNILQAYALYISMWVQGYEGLGLPIEVLMPQNEPSYDTSYSSCLWPPPLYEKFIAQYLGPQFASLKLDTQIYVGTMSDGDPNTDDTILSDIMADQTAMKYVKGFGMQWNVLSQVPSVTPANLPIWQTEHKCGNYHWLTPFNPNQAPNDFPYAVESWGNIRDWIKAGVNTYGAWNMVLDTIGIGIAKTIWPQNALLTVDRTSKTLNVTPAYYVFRHVSQYVVPGAQRVATSGSSSLDSLAFKNQDGSIVTIMYNSGSSAVSTTLSANHKLLQFSVPANAFATVKD